VAEWLAVQGRLAQVVFPAGATPHLVTPGGDPIETGYVLPNLEVVTEQDLTTIYERIADS
jgi:hypothetical protein